MPRTVTEWIMAVLLGVSLFCVATGQPAMMWIGFTCFILTVIIGIASFEEVPADPNPSVAMPTFLGERYDVLVKEGWVFVLPGIERLIIEDYLPEDLPLSFDEVRCLLPTTDGQKISGGSVTVEVSVVYTPDITDAARFRSFLNRGKRPKISKILEGMLGESIRLEGAKMTWDELTFAKARLSAQLISDLTGLTPPPDNDDSVKKFLDTALVSGVADVKDLGIKISRLNVVEIEPEGELKKNAERAAIELLQRKAEQTEVDTVTQLAQQLVDKAKQMGQDMSFTDALDRVQVQQGRAKRIFVTSSGKSNPFVDAAAVMQAGSDKDTPDDRPNS